MSDKTIDVTALFKGEEITADLPYAGAVITVKYLTRKEIEELRDSSMEKSFGKLHTETQTLNRDVFYKKVALAAIKGWSGFIFDDGELPCTPENIGRLFDTMTGLDNAIYELSTSFAAMQILQRANAAKKSKLTSGTEGTTQG